MGSENEWFGDERLKEIFCRIGGSSAIEIRRHILNDLKSYDAKDDVTLVILKKN